MTNIYNKTEEYFVRLMGRNSNYNNEFKSNKEISFFFNFSGVRFLFDTCYSIEDFKYNFLKIQKKIKVNPDMLILSHFHEDHILGVPFIVELYPDIPVYTCDVNNTINLIRKHFPHYDTSKVKWRIVSKKITTITPRLKLLIIKSDILEIYPAMRISKGWIIFSGCGHARENILLESKKLLKDDIYMLIGGIHSWGYKKSDTINLCKNIANSGIKKIGSFHCCGEIFRREAIKQFGKDNMLDYTSMPIGKKLYFNKL